MNVGEVMDTVEQGVLLRQLSSLERFILCQSWGGRGYSEMAPDCAYSIAHIKDIGSQLWQALSTAIGERVTKKNLFLVLKEYLLSRTVETVANDQLSVTLELVEIIDQPLTPNTNQLPVTTELMEASYSGESEQLLRLSDCPFAKRLEEKGSVKGDSEALLRSPYSSSGILRQALPKASADCCELVTEESSQLKRVQQEYQTSCDNTDIEDNGVAELRYDEVVLRASKITHI